MEIQGTSELAATAEASSGAAIRTGDINKVDERLIRAAYEETIFVDIPFSAALLSSEGRKA